MDEGQHIQVVEENARAASSGNPSTPEIVSDRGKSYALLFFDGGYEGDQLFEAIKRRRQK